MKSVKSILVDSACIKAWNRRELFRLVMDQVRVGLVANQVYAQLEKPVKAQLEKPK